MEDGFEKYTQIGKTLAFAEKRKLNENEAMKKLQGMQKKLSKNKLVKKEFSAEKAYNKLLKQEKTYREKMKGNSLKKTLVALARGYKSLAGRYKDTVYGKKALEKFEEIQEELQ
jgi:hypothetical protein